MKIIKAESLDTKLGKKKYFKGDVWLEDISREAPDTRLILVYFAPKSRTYWHKHSEAEQIAGEQILYVIAGKGRVKREEDEKGYEIYPGDVVYIAGRRKTLARRGTGIALWCTLRVTTQARTI